MSKQSDLISVSQGAAGDPLLVDAANNRVGVGTSSPAARLGIPSPLYSSSFTGGMIRFQNPDVAADSCIQSYHVTGAGSDVFIGANSYVNLSGSTVRFSDSYAASYINVRRDGDIDFSTNTSAGNPTIRLRIDAAGRVTMPYQPMFTARGYNGLSGGFQLYDVVDFDIGNNFNNTNGRFTAPIAGTYFASFGSGYKAAENYLGYGLNKNGTPLYLSWSGNQTNENHQFNGGGFLVSMSASDYLQVSVSSGYTTPDPGTIYTYFSVYLVG